MSADTRSEYRIHLDRYDIDGILHLCHPIPVGRGITRERLAEVAPGFELGPLVALFRTVGVVIPFESHCRLRCHWAVDVVHLDGPTPILVDWNPDATDDARWWPQGRTAST